MPEQVGKGKDLQRLINVCLKNNIPFASFSMPGKKDITTFIQVSGQPILLEEALEAIVINTGFVFAPFEKDNEQYKKWFLKPDFIIENDNISSDIFAKLNETSYNNISIPEVPLATSREDFEGNVQKIINAINTGDLSKVVLSRTKILEVENINNILADLFIDLDNTYPNAFCFISNLPGTGCWMGATPEPLLFAESENFHTVALAGTKYLNGVPVENVEWSVKEIHEQAVVSHYIEEQLNLLHANIQISNGPFNSKAAKLVHLKTDFFFNLPKSKDNINSLLTALHPTPSVCGLPVAGANDTIKKLESHQRSYYAGYLGPVNYNNKSNIFVNLRSLQVIDDKIILYAGAGITGKSIPEKEWKETEHKLETMLSVIKTKVEI